MRYNSVFMVAAVLLLACVPKPPEPPALGAHMEHYNGSPMDGEATLVRTDWAKHLVRVEIKLDGAYIPENQYPAGIYRSTCADTITAKAAYPLSAVATGQSTSVVTLPLRLLQYGSYAIVVFSPTHPERVLSCGVIKA